MPQIRKKLTSLIDDIALDKNGRCNGFDIEGYPTPEDDFETWLFTEEDYDDGWW